MSSDGFSKLSLQSRGPAPPPFPLPYPQTPPPKKKVSSDFCGRFSSPFFMFSLSFIFTSLRQRIERAENDKKDKNKWLSFYRLFGHNVTTVGSPHTHSSQLQWAWWIIFCLFGLGRKDLRPSTIAKSIRVKGHVEFLFTFLVTLRAS